jgi:hypothetical protein
VNSALELGGVLQTLILGANGSQELGSNRVRGVRVVNDTETLPKKGRGDTGKNVTLRIIKTDEKFHVVVSDDAFEKGLRELEDEGGLWVRRKVSESHRGAVNAQEDAAKRGGLAVRDIANAESQFLARANRELVEIKPSSSGREALREGRQEIPEDIPHLRHLPGERFESIVRVDRWEVGNEVSNLPGRRR